jgi:hypothetical protein
MRIHRIDLRLAAGSIAAVSLCLAFTAQAHAQQLAVVRVGDGVTPLSGASAPAFIDEFTTAGSPLRTLALPVTDAGPGGNAPLTLTGNATSEGHLRLSTNGKFLTLAGYGTAPGLAGVATSQSATVNRVVARINLAGIIDTQTRSSVVYNGGNIRGVITDDGTRFWTTGTAATNGGAELIPYGVSATNTMLAAAPTNARVPGIFGGQLYMTSASGAFVGLDTIGPGIPTLPTSSGQTTTLLPGFTSDTGGSPYGFVAFDLDPNVAGVDRVYVADDRQTASGGIQRWTFDGTTWTLGATFAPAGPPFFGVRGLAAALSGGNVVLFATTGETTANTIVTATDDGVSTSLTFTVLATAPANTAFRGIELLPAAPPVPAAPPSMVATLALMLALAGLVGVGATRKRRRL